MHNDTRLNTHTGGNSPAVSGHTGPGVADSGENTLPLTSPGDKPAFGDLDESEDYFSYDEYLDEVTDPGDGIPAVAGPPTPWPVAIIRML